MGFFKKIFGKENASRPSNSDKMEQREKRITLPDVLAKNWYFSEDKKRGLNQIVLNLDGRSTTKSRFGNLILNRNKYGPLFSDLAVGFFDLETNPGPFLLVKNSRYAKELANESITLAFTFCHMPSGPLFAIFMYPNSKQERLPPGACFTDQVYNINDFKELITGAFKKDKMTIVFAQGGGMAGIDCLFDVEYILNNSLHDKFIEQWSKLIEHGKSVRSFSFEASREELYARTPTNESPILRLK